MEWKATSIVVSYLTVRRPPTIFLFPSVLRPSRVACIILDSCLWHLSQRITALMQFHFLILCPFLQCTKEFYPFCHVYPFAVTVTRPKRVFAPGHITVVLYMFVRANKRGVSPPSVGGLETPEIDSR